MATKVIALVRISLTTKKAEQQSNRARLLHISGSGESLALLEYQLHYE